MTIAISEQNYLYAVKKHTVAWIVSTFPSLDHRSLENLLWNEFAVGFVQDKKIANGKFSVCNAKVKLFFDVTGKRVIV